MEFNTYTISVRGLFKKYFEILADEDVLYTAKSTSIFNKQYVLYDTYDREVLRIKQKIGFFKLRYLIIQNDYVIGQVEKPALDNKLFCEGEIESYSVSGNLLNTQYDIYFEGQQVAKVSRKIFRLKKSYGIAVQADIDQLHIISLCIILVLVNIMRQKG